jgi:hypothetical protein
MGIVGMSHEVDVIDLDSDLMVVRDCWRAHEY